METTIQSQQANVSARDVKAVSIEVKTNSISDFWKNAEFNRFGIIAFIVVIIACMGGISVAFGAMSDTFELAMVAIPTMISLAFILSVAPMRLIIWSSAIVVLLDLLILVF